ncbi:MAG: hypothetical protein E6H41_11730 [Betaproteobacteria bacterium]|nr:MAG: hypothetical protein E6H41_11730 [Betaproteobacteria bacterium]
MSLRRNAVVQIVFAFLLLLAQQGALTHEIWQSEQKTPDSNKNRLCDLHASLGTVLGAVTGVVAAAPPVAAPQPALIASESPAASVSLLAPPSRGPPALS